MNETSVNNDPIHQNPASPRDNAAVHDAAPSQNAGHAAAPLVIDRNARISRMPIFLVGSAALVIAVLILLGILRRAHAESHLKDTTSAAAIPDVRVTTPTPGAAAQEIRLPANTRAYIDTPIYSRTNGYLQKWFADIGTNVHKGTLLAIIQSPEVDQQVIQAKADVATAQAAVNLAKITSDRWQSLLAKNAVSRQEADQVASDLISRQSALNSSQANLSRLEQLQGFEHIYAPFDGVITARNVDIGSLIQGGDSTNARAELFHMGSVDKLRLFVPVPEVYANAVREGSDIAITSDAAPNEVFHGTVARSSDSIDTLTRTLNMEVDMNNAGHHMLPGQYAFVHLPLPASSASMTLPANALLFRADGLRVGVVHGGRVHLQPISVGHDYGATVEVTAGLHPGDQVILDPADSLAEGAAVHVETGAASTQGAAE